MDLLSSTDPLANSDAVVYGVGTLKLLATNPQLREELGRRGVVDLLQQYLQQCSSSVSGCAERERERGGRGREGGRERHCAHISTGTEPPSLLHRKCCQMKNWRAFRVFLFRCVCCYQYMHMYIRYSTSRYSIFF